MFQAEGDEGSWKKPRSFWMRARLSFLVEYVVSLNSLSTTLR